MPWMLLLRRRSLIILSEIDLDGFHKYLTGTSMGKGMETRIEIKTFASRHWHDTIRFQPARTNIVDGFEQNIPRRGEDMSERLRGQPRGQYKLTNFPWTKFFNKYLIHIVLWGEEKDGINKTIMFGHFVSTRWTYKDNGEVP